jgi:hypothetical protein
MCVYGHWNWVGVKMTEAMGQVLVCMVKGHSCGPKRESVPPFVGFANHLQLLAGDEEVPGAHSVIVKVDVGRCGLAFVLCDIVAQYMHVVVTRQCWVKVMWLQRWMWWVECCCGLFMIAFMISLALFDGLGG